MVDMEALLAYKNKLFEEYCNEFEDLQALIRKSDGLELISRLSCFAYTSSIDGIGPISPALVEFVTGLVLNEAYIAKGKLTSRDFADIWMKADKLLLHGGGINFYGNVTEDDTEDDLEKKLFLGQLKNGYAYTRGYSWNKFIEKENTEGIFGGFEAKAESVIGFYPQEIFDILEAYQSMMRVRLEEWKNGILSLYEGVEMIDKFLSSELTNVAGFTLQDLARQCESVSLEHIDNFLEFFSCEVDKVSNNNFMYQTDDNILAIKPILKYKKTYYIPNFQMIAWNFRQLIEDEIKRNEKLWSEYDKKFKAKFLEEESIKVISKILPQCEIYKSLFYKPENEETPCELDAMVIYDTTIVLVEAKSCIYSKPARRGGLKRLEKDIYKNIEYAYVQANRTRGYIEKNEISYFYSDAKLTKLVKSIDRRKVTNIFIINTTLDYYAELSVELYKLKRFGIYKETEFPWTICISDLKVISDFIDFPNQFLYYLMLRRNMNNSLSDKNGAVLLYELDLFAMYKFEDTELFHAYDCEETVNPRVLLDMFKKEEQLTVERCISKDYSQYFYKFYADYDRTKKKPEYPRKVYNPRFLQMCRQLEEYKEEGFSNFIYHFLDMDLDDQNELFRNVDDLCERVRIDKQMHTITIKRLNNHFCNELCGMVVYCGYVRDRQKIELLASKAGYIQQALTAIKHWIVLCIYLDDERHFINQFYYYIGDEEIQEELDAIAKHIPVQKGKKIGRNEPCLCGSGKKYKKCCGK